MKRNGRSIFFSTETFSTMEGARTVSLDSTWIVSSDECLCDCTLDVSQSWKGRGPLLCIVQGSRLLLKRVTVRTSLSLLVKDGILECTDCIVVDGAQMQCVGSKSAALVLERVSFARTGVGCFSVIASGGSLHITDCIFENAVMASVVVFGSATAVLRGCTFVSASVFGVCVAAGARMEAERLNISRASQGVVGLEATVVLRRVQITKGTDGVQVYKRSVLSGEQLQIEDMEHDGVIVAKSQATIRDARVAKCAQTAICCVKAAPVQLESLEVVDNNVGLWTCWSQVTHRSSVNFDKNLVDEQ